MKRLLLAAAAAACAVCSQTGPAMAYTDGSSEFIGNVFRNPNRIYVGNSSSSRRTRENRRTSRRARPENRSAARAVGNSASGIASYYWQPQRVASGGWFNPNALTAAHKTLPFGTRVRVTNLNNGRSVVVRINDRGPYIKGRIIDLSRRAAGVIGMRGSGLARVNLQILGRG